MTTNGSLLSKDEGLRDGTTYEAVAGIRTAVPGGVVSAGNASQFSDGAGACVVMNGKLAEQRVTSNRSASSAASRSRAA